MLQRDEIDLISVCVPNFLHHDVVLASAQAGKDIVCEKPIATNVEDAKEMIRVCKEKGVTLIYAEDWVFSPALMRVDELIEEGAIGKVLYVKARECHNGTHSPFAKDKKFCGGGALIHLAIHPIGWILHLLCKGGENKVVDVIGVCTGGADKNYVHKDNTGDDFALGIMRFANGETAFVEGNYITVGGMDDRIEIYGTEGVIKINMTMGSNVDVYSRPGYSYCIEKTDNTLGWTKPAVDEFYNLGYVHELAYAVECIQTRTEPKYGVSPQAGLACLQIANAMYESAETGKTVYGQWG